MTVSVLEQMRIEFARQAAKPVFLDQQTSGISFQQYSQWFDLVPATKRNVLAAYVKFTYTVSGGTITPVTGADNLSVILGQVQVAATARVMPRSQTITKNFFEDVEQVTFDTNYGYPRAAPPSTAGTYSGFFYVPVGGQAAALRLLLPSATAAYSAGTVVIDSITVYVIEGDTDVVVAFKENNTPQLGTSIQSIKNYLPDDIAPDVLILVGDTGTSITQVFLVEQAGQITTAVTDVDALTNGLLAITPRTGKLGTSDFGISLQGAVLTIAQFAFASSATHDIGVIQYQGSGSVSPSTPQTTVAPPAVGQTGVENAAGKPSLTGGGRRVYSPPMASRFAIAK